MFLHTYRISLVQNSKCCKKRTTMSCMTLRIRATMADQEEFNLGIPVTQLISSKRNCSSMQTQWDSMGKEPVTKCFHSMCFSHSSCTDWPYLKILARQPVGPTSLQRLVVRVYKHAPSIFVIYYGGNGAIHWQILMRQQAVSTFFVFFQQLFSCYSTIVLIESKYNHIFN